MPTISANALAVKAALKKGVRASYKIAGHEGLTLEARVDGTGSYVVRYRVGGKQREKVLHGDASRAALAEIIAAKDELRTAAKVHGRDLVAEREAKTKAKQVEATASAYTYDAAFYQWLDNPGRKRSLSKRTRQEYEGIHKRHVSPLLGKRPIAALIRADIDKALRAIFDATNDPKNGQRGLQATKAYQNVRSVLEWAVDEERIPSNPVRLPSWLPAKENPKGKQSRAPTDAELRQLWLEGPKVMTEAQYRVMVLAILLGRRVSEIAGAQRPDVHLAATTPYLIIPAHREGNKAKAEDAIPLPKMAAGIVRDALAVGKPSDPLFVGAATRWTTSKALTDARREWGWPGQVRLHDMRTLINDHMARMGVPTEIRSRTLHHTGDLRQLANTVYSSFDHMPERLRALRLWQARLKNIVSGRRSHDLRWLPKASATLLRPHSA